MAEDVAVIQEGADVDSIETSEDTGQFDRKLLDSLGRLLAVVSDSVTPGIRDDHIVVVAVPTAGQPTVTTFRQYNQELLNHIAEFLGTPAWVFVLDGMRCKLTTYGTSLATLEDPQGNIHQIRKSADDSSDHSGYMGVGSLD